MSTADYKRGVKDGTAAFGSEHVFPGTNFKVHTPGVELVGEPLGVRIEQLLKERRKKLLTKKVTKWVAVGIAPSNGKPYAQGYFQDTKESALANKTGDPGDPTFIGAYPIEIETEI